MIEIDPELWPLFYVGRLTAVMLPGTPDWVCFGGATITDGAREEPVTIHRVTATLLGRLAPEEFVAAGIHPWEAEPKMMQAVAETHREAWAAAGRPVTLVFFERRMDG